MILFFTSEIHSIFLRSSSNFQLLHQDPTLNYFVTHSFFQAIWNSFPEYIKTASSVKHFKSLYLRLYKQIFWKLVLCSWYYTVCATFIMYMYRLLLYNVVLYCSCILFLHLFFLYLFYVLRSLRQIDNCQVSILVKSSIYYLLLLLHNSLSNIVNVCFMWHGHLVTTC